MALMQYKNQTRNWRRRFTESVERGSVTRGKLEYQDDAIRSVHLGPDEVDPAARHRMPGWKPAIFSGEG